MTAWGLISGISITEQRGLEPGFVCDLFVLRRAYDDEQHGIIRKTDDHDISAEDQAIFDQYEREMAGKEGDWSSGEGY